MLNQMLWTQRDNVPVAAMWAMRRTPTSTTSMKRLSSCALAVLREKHEKNTSKIWKKNISTKRCSFQNHETHKLKNTTFCNSAQFHTISSKNWVDLANLHDTVLLRVCAPCEAKMCICDYSHPRLFQRHFSRRGKPWLQDQDQHFVSFCFFVLSEPSSSIIFHFAFSQKPRINQTKRTLDFACLSVCLSLVVWFYWTDKASFVSC